MKKQSITTLTKEVLDNDNGHRLLAVLFDLYADNPTRSESLIDTGVSIGKAELVRDLMRMVHGKGMAGAYKRVIENNELDNFGD